MAMAKIVLCIHVLLMLMHRVSPTFTYSITTAQEQQARDACMTVIDIRIADFVRTIFHDCVGGCNGCIDVNNPSNAGLSEYVDVLEDLYQRYAISEFMTRADFWAVCSVVAVEEGHRRSAAADPLPSITLLYGRRDCACTPKQSSTNKFPDAHHGLKETLEFFYTNFGFNEQETVALLGAHTLGETKKENSGFYGPWVPDKKALDNDYYKQMIERRWYQRNVGNVTHPRHQWMTYDIIPLSDEPFLMMLNSDICLFKAVAPASDGRESRFLSYLPKSDVFTLTQSYANDNMLWLEHFAAVFEKMIHHVPAGVELSPPVSIPEVVF